jgi:hypothetical protein
MTKASMRLAFVLLLYQPHFAGRIEPAVNHGIGHFDKRSTNSTRLVDYYIFEIN